MKILGDAENSEAYCAAIFYRQAGFYALLEDLEHAKEKLEVALSEDFEAHIDFIENFPALEHSDWVNELIEKCRPTD